MALCWQKASQFEFVSIGRNTFKIKIYFNMFNKIITQMKQTEIALSMLTGVKQVSLL